jgi:hypothetical protein
MERVLSEADRVHLVLSTPSQKSKSPPSRKVREKGGASLLSMTLRCGAGIP